MGEEERKESGRQSRDCKVDKKDRLMLDFIEEKRCMILNENVRKDKEGKYTFTGRGCVCKRVGAR